MTNINKKWLSMPGNDFLGQDWPNVAKKISTYRRNDLCSHEWLPWPRNDSQGTKWPTYPKELLPQPRNYSCGTKWLMYPKKWPVQSIIYTHSQDMTCTVKTLIPWPSNHLHVLKDQTQDIRRSNHTIIIIIILYNNSCIGACTTNFSLSSSSSTPSLTLPPYFNFTYTIFVDDVISDVAPGHEHSGAERISQELLSLSIWHVESEADRTWPVDAQRLQHLQPICAQLGHKRYVICSGLQRVVVLDVVEMSSVNYETLSAKVITLIILAYAVQLIRNENHLKSIAAIH